MALNIFCFFSANNFAMKGKRKTLNASDVLSAMEEMEFQRFITPLKEALEGNDLFIFSVKWMLILCYLFTWS